MFNIFGFAKGLKSAGVGYVVLNLFRAMNIITLGVVVAASWIMMVRTVQTSQFFFFDSVTHFVTSSVSIFLIVSELCFFQNYFSRDWPLLSKEHSGFVFLSLTLLILGFNILGNLNKVATSQENLGLPFWRVVIAAGILSLIMGVLNLFGHYFFRNRKMGINARMIRAHGAKALFKASISDKGSLSRSNSAPRSFDLPQYIKTNDDSRRSRLSRAFGFGAKKTEISRPVPQDSEAFGQWEKKSNPIGTAHGMPPMPPMPASPPPARRHPAYTASVYSTDTRI
jgi:hypothetical protein